MLSLLNRKWLVADPSPDTVAALSGELKIAPLVARLLVNRGIADPGEARVFIQPDLGRLPDPFLMLGMREATDRVVRAIQGGERITVFGDYDVDGVTAAAFLVHFFRELGTPFSYYLPNRMEEGYGLNVEALRKIRAEGSSLVISADCGITAVREVDAAREMGLDVIVTDHHQLSEEGLPRAVAVLNPHQPGCGYPFRFLSGVGIVFKLAAAVRSALAQAGWEKEKLPNLKRHLDLFALGTIADMAPLAGENHVLSRHGLQQMTVTAKPGLVALKSIAGLNGSVDARSVAFALGPRLNAAGRLGKADVGLHLLTASDLPEAKKMAQTLDDVNQERQEVQKWTQEEAEYLLQREIDLERDRVIVLASENFHMGVIGIVAARLAQTHYRPTVLIALRDAKGKGSARSIPKFNLFKAFRECSSCLVQYGGHAYAAGLNIEQSRVDAFRKAMNEVGRRILSPGDLVPEVSVDAVLSLADISMAMFKEIQQLSPFGAGNSLPVFMSRKVAIQDLRFIGKDGQHVRFRAVQGKSHHEAVGFHMREAFASLDSRGNLFDLVYEIQTNDWNGQEKLQLKLLDLRPDAAED
ncbi:MAG: single-stranded-DNA-specific exonuclease RecJ [Nitrospinae bacterium]|nr:single-stranded-DNA-specific exonuclease RecJ [Nitrospinota bacterium]